jgi:hypothetical protein
MSLYISRSPDRRFENYFNEIRLGRKPPLQDTIIKYESEPKFDADSHPGVKLVKIQTETLPFLAMARSDEVVQCRTTRFEG